MYARHRPPTTPARGSAHGKLPTSVTTPDDTHPSLFDRLGGADAVRALVDRFYDEMDASPAARELRGLHPADLENARERLYLFLSGWFGGPPLYVQRHGHPRLRARHLPFPITTRERDQWLACMAHALEGTPLARWEREQAMSAFARMADHMRNRSD